MSFLTGQHSIPRHTLIQLSLASGYAICCVEKTTSTINFCNVRFCEIIGLQSFELEGKALIDYLSTHLPWEETLISLANPHVQAQVEWTTINQLRPPVWLSTISETYIFDEKEYFYLTFIDTTEKKKQENAKNYHSQQLQALYGLLDDVIVVVDSQGTYLNIARTATNFFFKDPKSLEGRKITELFPEENALEITRKLKYAISSGHSLHFEYLLPINGVEYWFNMSIKPMDATKALVVARDITASKKLEQQLERNYSFSQNLLSKIPIPVYVYDFELNQLIYANEAHSQLTGYQQDHLVKKEAQVLMPSLVHPEDLPTLQNAMASIQYLQDHDKLEYSYRAKHASGYYQWLEDTTKVFARNDKGQVVQTITTSKNITSHIQTREALNQHKALLDENNRVFETLLDNLPGMACRFENHIDWPMKFISVGCYALTGYNVTEFLNGTVHLGKITHPLDNESVYDTIQEALAQKRSYHVFYRIRTKDGEEKWLSEQGKGIYAADGSLQMIEAYIQDITSTRLYEQRLLKSEERFRSITESVSLPLLISRYKDGKILYANKLYSKMVGVEPEELIFKYTTDFYFHPEDRAKILKSFEENGVLREFELLGKDNMGEPIWLILNSNIINYNGEEAICTTFNDITERKKSEEALRNSEAKIASLINNTMDFILSIDKDFHITALNDPLKNMLQASTGEGDFTGASIFDIIPKERHEATYENFKEVLKGNKVVVEHYINQLDGELQYVEDSYNPIKNALGQVEGISIFTRDITERRKSEIQLKNTLKELKERNYELDTFVYKVSHDLRAPLRSVLGLVNLMKINRDEETYNLCMDKIEESMQRMDAFIQTVLVYSRTLNNGLESQKILFEAIIKECVEELRYTKDSDRLKIELDIKEDFEFWNDYFRLTIIFKNFISNAIKYMNHDRMDNMLWIKVHAKATHAEIWVKDNGIGMDTQVQAKIFEMFYRGTERSDSSGLGLYIVKLNIEKLEGVIKVESQPQNGTSFYIQIPNKVVVG